VSKKKWAEKQWNKLVYFCMFSYAHLWSLLFKIQELSLILMVFWIVSSLLCYLLHQKCCKTNWKTEKNKNNLTIQNSWSPIIQTKINHHSILSSICIVVCWTKAVKTSHLSSRTPSLKLYSLSLWATLWQCYGVYEKAAAPATWGIL